MAENHHNHGSHSTGGSMDITEHVKMWNSFWNVSKWSAVSLIILAALLALFRTHNGY
jgi:hypothetical protein